MQCFFRTTGFTLCLSMLTVWAICRPASAQTIYATSVTTNQIYTVDAVTHVVTPIFNTGAALDSLFFDSDGRIIYSQLN